MEVPYAANPLYRREWEKWSKLLERLDQIWDRTAATHYEQAHNVLKLSPEDRELYLQFMEAPPRFEEIDGKSFPIPRWLHFLKQEFVGAPVLVLACKGEPRFLSNRDWYYVEVQTAGYACHHPKFYALNLPVKAGVFERMVTLEKNFFGSQISTSRGPLEDVIGYRDALKSIFSDKIDCNGSFRWLEEAIYPIDFTAEAIEALIDADKEFRQRYDKLEWCYPHCDLLVLTANSD